MQALAVSFARRIAAATLAASLTFTLVPFAYADGEGSGFEGVFDSRDSEAKQVPLGVTSPQLPSDPSTEAASTSVTLSGAAEGGEAEGSSERPLTLASGLVGTPSNFINSDVALDSEPVIGSFTVDGLTYAVIDGPYVELVGVSSDRQQVMNLQEGEGSGVAPMLASGPYGTGSKATALVLPETVSYVGVSHIVSSVGAYAFYLSGISSVTLPASISNVDDRAFRSSDVASVLVADDNPFYSSFDGALYDAEQLSLLLIPEGKQGTVRIPKTAEVAEASVFSHCLLVDAISVDAGSAAFASENGLLYDASLTTLLRVPAGATDITIREGCATIAAGVMEACANLTTINAPATVTSISPDVFTSVPIVSLPVASLAEAAPRLTAMVALLSTDDDLPQVLPSVIVVMLPKDGSATVWELRGFIVTPEEEGGSFANTFAENLQNGVTYGAVCYTRVMFPSGPESIFDNRVTLGDSSTMSLKRETWLEYTTRELVRFYDGKFWYDYSDHSLPAYASFGAPKNGGVLTMDAGPSPDALQEVTPSAEWKRYGTYNYVSLNKAHMTFSLKWDVNDGSEPQEERVRGGSRPQAPQPERPGFAFVGWFTAREGGEKVCDAGGKASTVLSDATYYAQWLAVEEAVVPLDVVARIDVLGLEAPKEAQGYIESRCGEPLKVAEMKLTPLDGAKELFGAGNVADVFLEVLAEGSTSPNARFSLGSSATESDASKLQALTMASYGTKVPISYRFAMAPDVQTSLVEHADPKPVCTVAYTVALANPTT